MNDMSHIELASRIEWADKLEKKLEERYSKSTLESQRKIADLEKEVASLRSQLDKASSTSKGVVSDRERVQDKIIRDLEGTVSSMRAKFAKHHEQTKLLKEEHAKFKQLNPIETKKKLDKAKKDLKEAKSTITELSQKIKRNLKIISGQKQELEKVSAIREAASDSYLFESECKLYKVFGTAFSSEHRPFVVNEMNYRVMRVDTGAAYVAKLVEGNVVFEESDKIPSDVISFVQCSIAFETAEDK